MTTSFWVDSTTVSISIDVDGIGSFVAVAVAVAVVAAPGFCMVSVTAFIILYGLLLLPRIDLGKYWSSMEGVYSGGCADAVMGAVMDAVMGAVAVLNISFPLPRLSSVSLRVFIV